MTYLLDVTLACYTKFDDILTGMASHGGSAHGVENENASIGTSEGP